MKRIWMLVVLVSLILSGCALLDFINTDKLPDIINPPGEVDDSVFVNPEIDSNQTHPKHEQIAWKSYRPPHQDRVFSVRVPTSMVSRHGCTPQNTKMIVCGIEMQFYAIDTGDDNQAMKLSYTAKQPKHSLDEFSGAGELCELLKDGKRVLCWLSPGHVNRVYIDVPKEVVIPSK